MAKSVTIIPQTRNIFTTAPISTTARRKVAGYARVSTDSDEQFTSYEAQVDYYTNYIQSHPEWEFVKVYTDEGISAVAVTTYSHFDKDLDYNWSGEADDESVLAGELFWKGNQPAEDGGDSSDKNEEPNT